MRNVYKMYGIDADAMVQAYLLDEMRKSEKREETFEI